MHLSFTITEHARIESRRWARVGAIVVLAFFGLPLFIGLDHEDLGNDEAIYSYAVDRVLETGDWLTPRSIPFDGPFLEKPPLKVWIVAGLIQAGLVAHDERGLRFADALFGATAFLYVYALGCLLAGPICGIVAVLVLFTFGPLVFVHGLRSNNMEAALLLAYSGGLYHFARWDHRAGGAVQKRGMLRAPPRPEPRRAAHALAVGVYFALGFMMKFVAVLFLPLICALALLWRAAGERPRVGELWRAWVGPAALAIALCAPWFVAAWMAHGRLVWNVMFGDHVYRRLTASLDPAHLAPWTAYVEWIWGDLVHAGTAWIVVPGLVLLLVRALAGTPLLARLVLLWLILPLALMSMGTSKLPHYAYPFLPPLAIAAGYLVASVVAVITGPIAARSGRLVRSVTAIESRHRRSIGVARGVLLAGGALALLVAVWTVLDGRVLWDLGAGVRLSNASIARPLIIGASLVWLGAVPLSALHAWLVLVLMLLPIAAPYERVVQRLRHVDRPLSTLRACTLEVQRTNPAAARGVYNAARGHVSHPFFYYMRPLGPWTFADAPSEQEIRRRLIAGEEEAPILVSREGFGVLIAALDPSRRAEPAPASLEDELFDSAQTAVTGVTDRHGQVIVVLPGPYQACVLPVAAAGWTAVGDGTTTRTDR